MWIYSVVGIKGKHKAPSCAEDCIPMPSYTYGIE